MLKLKPDRQQQVPRMRCPSPGMACGLQGAPHSTKAPACPRIRPAGGAMRCMEGVLRRVVVSGCLSRCAGLCEGDEVVDELQR